MESIAAELKRLRDLLESTAFLIGNNGSPEHLHSKLVEGVTIVSKLQDLASGDAPKSAISDQIENEVKKVKNRLKLWARRPHQINASILNAFLDLQKTGLVVIRERDIKDNLNDIKSFESNFNQMKIISEKNHGKIFEQSGEVVTLWPPIIPFIREYENNKQRHME